MRLRPELPRAGRLQTGRRPGDPDETASVLARDDFLPRRGAGGAAHTWWRLPWGATGRWWSLPSSAHLLHATVADATQTPDCSGRRHCRALTKKMREKKTSVVVQGRARERSLHATDKQRLANRRRICVCVCVCVCDAMTAQPTHNTRHTTHDTRHTAAPHDDRLSAPHAPPTQSTRSASTHPAHPPRNARPSHHSNRPNDPSPAQRSAVSSSRSSRWPRRPARLMPPPGAPSATRRAPRAHTHSRPTDSTGRKHAPRVARVA